jgi:hypothetical protein
VDSAGHYGGLITCWSSNCKLLNSFSICSGILTKIFSLELDHSFSILNLYGPYDGKEMFWSKIFWMQCLKVDSLVIGGDLNFMVNRSKIWGPKAHEDNLVLFLHRKF